MQARGRPRRSEHCVSPNREKKLLHFRPGCTPIRDDMWSCDCLTPSQNSRLSFENRQFLSPLPIGLANVDRLMAIGVHVSLARKEIRDALDHCCHTLCLVGAGHSDLIHDVRVHPHTAGARNRSCVDPGDSGEKPGTLAAPADISSSFVGARNLNERNRIHVKNHSLPRIAVLLSGPHL